MLTIKLLTYLLNWLTHSLTHSLYLLTYLPNWLITYNNVERKLMHARNHDEIDILISVRDKDVKF